MAGAHIESSGNGIALLWHLAWVTTAINRCHAQQALSLSPSMMQGVFQHIDPWPTLDSFGFWHLFP